jgi:hypothetical protein
VVAKIINQTVMKPTVAGARIQADIRKPLFTQRICDDIAAVNSIVHVI